MHSPSLAQSLFIRKAPNHASKLMAGVMSSVKWSLLKSPLDGTSPLPLCPQYSSMGTTGCGPPKVASSIGEGREIYLHISFSQPMVWHKSRSPKILCGQGMQEVSSRLVHLSEGVSLSKVPVSNSSWYKRNHIINPRRGKLEVTLQLRLSQQHSTVLIRFKLNSIL